VRTAVLDRLARDSIVAPGVAPAAVLGFAARAGSSWQFSVGAAGKTPDGLADPETIFDLASVTKPFVAATFASVASQGSIPLETELGALLPESRGTSVEHTTLERLLSHRAGLAPHYALFRPLVEQKPFVRRDALAIASNATRTPREANPAPEFPPVYSDLGYLLAGVALERALNAPLDALVVEHVSAPLGLRVGSARQWQRREPAFLRRVAPTESVAFRGGALRGVVHDENAWALSGHALAGHAGLFGTLEDVLKFGAALLEALRESAPGWLDRAAVEPLVRERSGGTLRLGFDGKSGLDSAAGRFSSSQTFGHLGFTGTSFWCDPVAESVTALLTNRVCPTRDNLGIRNARPLVHDVLFRTAAGLKT
jgi:CubicO group peptidase (beta-lactamase class C family)